MNQWVNSCQTIQLVGFRALEKLEYPEKNLSEQNSVSNQHKLNPHVMSSLGVKLCHIADSS